MVSVIAPTGYVATSSTAATKTGQPLVETLRAISIITRDQLTQRKVQTMNQALAHTADASALPRMAQIRALTGSTFAAWTHR